jgi:hypothetical protein
VAYDPLFESAWLKWAQAIVHSQTLERDVEARAANADADPIQTVRAQYDAKRHGFSIKVEEIEPIPVHWRLLLGDTANNLRAALDHLAWALVCRGRTPPDKLTAKEERAVYFPIFEDRLKYNAALPRCLPGVRRADLAKVRWGQPYRHGPSRRARHPLVLLARINNGDKHRTIQPLWGFPSRIDVEITHGRNCVPSGPEQWRRRGDHLEKGTEIAFVRARKLGPNPELEMKLNITVTPSIGNHISFREWNGWTGVFVMTLLSRFSDQPPSLHEIGAELIPLPPARNP